MKKTGDETVDSMFDKIVETKVMPDGTVEVNLVSDSAEDMENAVADFVQSYRQFRETNNLRPDAATEANLGMAWWKRLEYLALADSRLKECFCGRDRSPASVRHYHKYRLKLIDGKRYRTDA